jgi:hypothetical protein
VIEFLRLLSLAVARSSGSLEACSRLVSWAYRGRLPKLGGGWLSGIGPRLREKYSVHVLRFTGLLMAYTSLIMWEGVAWNSVRDVSGLCETGLGRKHKGQAGQRDTCVSKTYLTYLTEDGRLAPTHASASAGKGEQQ